MPTREFVRPGLDVVGTYLTGNIFTIGFSNNGVFLKDVVDQLRGDHDLDFSVDGLWARVH